MVLLGYKKLYGDDFLNLPCCQYKTVLDESISYYLCFACELRIRENTRKCGGELH